jgi:hypothetical protein
MCENGNEKTGLIWVVQVEVLACTVFLTWNAPLL